MKLSNLLAAAAIAGLQATAANAQEATIDDKGNMQCEGGDRKASDNLKPTPFANQFWSRMGCGYWEEAGDILNKAPKADSSEPLPRPEDIPTSPLAKCYYESFAYGPQYHAREIDRFDGSLSVHHGWYGIKDKMFSDIERAALEACKPAMM